MKGKALRLMDNCWKLCSEYVRRRDLGRCITCGIIKDWKEQHAGHLVHGKTTPIYFNEFNVNCQCPRCNRHLGGNLAVYAIKLVQKIGLRKVKWLLAQKFVEKRFKVGELQELIKYYQEKLKELP